MDLPFPWNYPRQRNRIVRYYTQLLGNFVHRDCFWKLHYGKAFTLRLLGSQRERFQMHRSHLSASVDTGKKREGLKDIWKSWPMESTKWKSAVFKILLVFLNVRFVVCFLSPSLSPPSPPSHYQFLVNYLMFSLIYSSNICWDLLCQLLC